MLTTRTNYYILMRDIFSCTTGCVLQEGEKETEGIAPEEGDAYEARCLRSRASWAWTNGPYPKKVTLHQDRSRSSKTEEPLMGEREGTDAGR